MRRPVPATLVMLVLAGCVSSPRRGADQPFAGAASSGRTPTVRHTPPTSATAPGPVASAPPVTRDNGARILVIVEENKDLGQIIGSGAAPFIGQLADQGVLLTSSYGVAHPSLPNYLSLLGGDTFGITTDCTDCTIDARNLVDQLDHAGLSWKGYMEDLPAPCATDARAGSYVIRHDPFLYFDDVRTDPGRCANVVPMDQLAQDAADNVLPRFSLVVPNVEHDMHDGSIAAADSWLRELYARIRSSPAWQADLRIVVTFDEGTDNQGCCGGLAAGGHIATIVAGPRIQGPQHDDTPYTHYSLLGSIEQAFGLPALGHAADPATATIPALTRTSP